MKQPNREDGHSAAPNGGVNEWLYISIPIRLHGVYRNNTTLLLFNRHPYRAGSEVAYWLRRCATSRTVPGSIPGGMTGDFFRGTPDRTMCPEVDSASESEYQGSPGVKAAGAFG